MGDLLTDPDYGWVPSIFEFGPSVFEYLTFHI